MSLTTPTLAGLDILIASGQPVVTMLGASWCAPCKVMKARLDSISEKLPKVTFAYVDADTQVEFFHKYGVRNVPTLLAFENGELTERVQNPMTTPNTMLWIDGAFKGDIS